MKRRILTLVSLSIIMIGCDLNDGGNTDGGSATSNTNAPLTVTAVDGYIKNATVKDSTGLIATYSSNGQYTFESSPVYPLSLTGGALEDTNASFDINMTAQNGSSVISPITTFMGNDSDILAKFANLGLGISTQDEFAIDYVANENTDLAKLSQMLYLVQKDANLTSTFKTTLSSNSPASLDDIFTLAESDVNTTISDTVDAQNYRIFLSTVKDYNGTASNFENSLKNHKYVFNSDILNETITHNSKTYKMVISPYTGKIWLDRNLGASRTCTSATDTQCYGDYYQWGRESDGHELSTSQTSGTKVSAITNVSDKFIVVLGDWTSADGDGLLREAYWSKTDGTSVCPKDFRVPNIDELKLELENITSVNNTLNNFLKIPLSGLRDFFGLNQGHASFFWSTTLSTTHGKTFTISSSSISVSNQFLGSGYPIRCIRD